MNVRLLCLGVLPLLISCTMHPLEQQRVFVPEPSPSAGVKEACASVYPQGQWQFVHQIVFSLADGSSSSVTGVVVVDKKTIQCALMTTEGFTLFAAQFTDRLHILRAVPPFDKPGFAAGLMNDVQVLFLPPPDGVLQYGRLAGKGPCCRIIRDKQITDILPTEDGCWQIRSDGNTLQQVRTLRAEQCHLVQGYRLPETLTLTAAGPNNYSLNMTLLSVNPPGIEHNP